MNYALIVVLPLISICGTIIPKWYFQTKEIDRLQKESAIWQNQFNNIKDKRDKLLEKYNSLNYRRYDFNSDGLDDVVYTDNNFYVVKEGKNSEPELLSDFLKNGGRITANGLERKTENETKR